METNQQQPKPYDQALKEAFSDHVSNSGGRSEYMQADFDAGFSAGYNAAMNNVAARKRDEAFKERIKHYFVSFTGIGENGTSITGCNIISFKNASLTKISEYLTSENKMKSKAIILNLRELGDEEYEMLNPNSIPQS
ncbi:MAG: hypothetical protein K2K45_07590 [Muribaculaceae bacterium]|nr:hypothetical protein [Muribaculaceae bacterium]